MAFFDIAVAVAAPRRIQRTGRSGGEARSAAGPSVGSAPQTVSFLSSTPRRHCDQQPATSDATAVDATGLHRPAVGSRCCCYVLYRKQDKGRPKGEQRATVSGCYSGWRMAKAMARKEKVKSLYRRRRGSEKDRYTTQTHPSTGRMRPEKAVKRMRTMARGVTYSTGSVVPLHLPQTIGT